MARPANYRPPAPGLPDYAEEEDLTATARAADLALLDEAIRLVRALVDDLTQLPDRAELGTTGRYIALAGRDLADTITWFVEARRELDTTPTRAEQAAYDAEQAALHRQLWLR